MTPNEVARAFGVRHTGNRKWWSAKCPAHRDRQASLSITDMGGGKTRLVCFTGCEQAEILRVKGMSWRDLRPAGNVSPEIRQRMSDEDHIERLEHRLGLMDMLHAAEKDKRNYWWKAIENTEAEIIQLRRKIYPDDRLPIRFRGTSLRPMKINQEIKRRIFDIDPDGEYRWMEIQAR